MMTAPTARPGELAGIITPLQLKKALPACKDISLWAVALSAAAQEFSIDTKSRFTMWLGNAAHESTQLNVLRENLSYSARGLMATWPKRFPTEAVALQFARQPQKLANYVYANRLGNGPFESNEGWKYRGGGLFQLTGKDNYVRAGKAVGVPLVNSPGKIEVPIVAARTAGWFWQSHGCNELADAGDFERIVETINGPAKLGLNDRLAFYKKVLEVLT